MNPSQNQESGLQNGQTGLMADLEQFFKTYLHDKIPFHLPPNVKEFLVKFGPWITLVVLIFSIPAILLLFGLSTLFVPIATVVGVRSGSFPIISIVFSLASLGLGAFSLPGLFNRQIIGWRLAYYAVLVSTLGQLLHNDIIGAVLGIAISMFVLFEIKDYYK